ncbi:outer membrane protein [Legionella tunisiensis]|uniref:outer membrane protein n=1 Tax=Legionella tunisiensis TaxID=1034944 RepID=UPI0002FD28EB|nr:outer membrane beta-barrel protein [Legionella tunisiensis]
MLRKTMIVFILLPLSCWSAGFYAGAGAGPDIIDFKQYAFIRSQHTPPNFDVIDKTHKTGKGVFGSLFAGHGWQHGCWYLAAETNVNVSTVEFDSANNEYVNLNITDTTFEMPYSYGLSALPGFLFSETFLFYGRAGYVNGRFKITTRDNSLASIHRNLGGFRAGLGMNQKFTEHLVLRMEYSYLHYKKTTFAVLNNETLKTTTITPTGNLVEFGVVYNLS